MNIAYDKYSPILDYKALNKEFNQRSLVKLSKYFLPEDKVGILNLNKGERFPIYDLIGNKHNIYARLVFDWVDKKNLSNNNTNYLKSNFDYLLLHEDNYKTPLKIEEFLFFDNVESYFIYRNKQKYFPK
tara:strand:- start:75 stop:461 length:387 start_codon:yes stop_codon:yes gene_type:complete